MTKANCPMKTESFSTSRGIYIYLLKSEVEKWRVRIAKAVLKSKNQVCPVAWCLDRKTCQKQRWATLRASLLPPTRVLGRQLASQPLHLSAPLTPTAPAGNQNWLCRPGIPMSTVSSFTSEASSNSLGLPNHPCPELLALTHLCSPSLHKLWADIPR